MPRILIIEDEEDMRFILSDTLGAEGYEVEGIGTGRDGVTRAVSGDFSLVILDIMLPDINGVEVCKAIRARRPHMPIIFLTAKGDEIDKVVGLEVGADDYVTKPFAMREFLARIKAALRRSSALLSEPLSECCVGQARVDFTTRQVLRDGSEESLTRYENDLLRFLALHRGEAVSRARILKEVWGADVPSGSRTVDNCVARLRAKIEPDPSRPRYLLTLHGSGYKLA